MNPDQANSVADALLREPLSHQAAVTQKRAKLLRRITARNRVGSFGIVGFGFGALAGYLIFANFLPAAMIGTALGMAIGRWFVGRGV